MTRAATPEAVAALLGGLRRASKRSAVDSGIPLAAVEALLHIAQGVDTVTDLQRVMGMSTGQASRTLSLLRGRGRLENGRWIESTIGLVSVTNHPHRSGYQLRLTDDALQLISSTFVPINTAGEHES